MTLAPLAGEGPGEEVAASNIGTTAFDTLRGRPYTQ
jgi:hypothetical protein